MINANKISKHFHIIIGSAKAQFSGAHHRLCNENEKSERPLDQQSSRGKVPQNLGRARNPGTAKQGSQGRLRTAWLFAYIGWAGCSAKRSLQNHSEKSLPPTVPFTTPTSLVERTSGPRGGQGNREKPPASECGNKRWAPRRNTEKDFYVAVGNITNPN